MKILNIFKKKTTSKNLVSKNSSIQQLEKNQLEKVIGGIEGTTNTTRSNTKDNY
jgi:23S rRNA pseudoU1915 N3-methylase RlmH